MCPSVASGVFPFRSARAGPLGISVALRAHTGGRIKGARQGVAAIPAALRGIGAKAYEGRFVVERLHAVCPDGVGVSGVGSTARVRTHRGGGAP